MTFFVKGKKGYHHRVSFKGRKVGSPSQHQASSSSTPPSRQRLDEDELDSVTQSKSEIQTGNKFSRREVTGQTTRKMAAKTTHAIPDLFTSIPFLHDSLYTESSEVQDKTVQECLPFLSGIDATIPRNKHGVPRLERARHIKFLHKNLCPLPCQYSGYDASRPWLFYWCLGGLATLGEDISPYRERLIATVRPIQNATGGFGGGNGQMSHLAPTYAIALCLAMMGGEECLEIIDRKAMWKWLGVLKQPDGGFQMVVGGEEDIRAGYIAMVLITLFNLPVELSKDSPAFSSECTTLVSGLPEWISRCQTFEGGMSAKPDIEAHGGYAFCALACLCIIDEPHIIIPKYLDVPLLVSWLSARQYAPEAGFSGRTNKLVDGCYSHWVGGCWPLLEACLNGPSLSVSPRETKERPKLAPASSVGHLYSSEGLIRYILCCCQDQSNRGGLRDKPSHKADAYHTLYVLSGLSSAQNIWHFNTSLTKPESPGVLPSPYQWTSEPLVKEAQIYDEVDRVGTLHPVFVIPEGCAEAAKAYFASKEGF